MSLRVNLLALLAELQRELGMAYLFITHDLSTVRQIADRVVVMHRGKVTGRSRTSWTPAQPYTKALIRHPSDGRLAAPGKDYTPAGARLSASADPRSSSRAEPAAAHRPEAASASSTESRHPACRRRAL